MRQRTRTTRPEREDEEISKAYFVKYEGEYFAGWKGTNWATVPRTALWTKDRKQAAQVKIDTVIDRQDLMHIVTGFSNTKLIAANMEEQRNIGRKPKIWISNRY